MSAERRPYKFVALLYGLWLLYSLHGTEKIIAYQVSKRYWDKIPSCCPAPSWRKYCDFSSEFSATIGYQECDASVNLWTTLKHQTTDTLASPTKATNFTRESFGWFL